AATPATLATPAATADPTSSCAAPASAGSAAKAALTTYAPVHPTDVQTEAAQLSARFLTRFHYDAKPLDDAMSERIFTDYLKALDGGKMFFTQADIDKFAPLKNKLDDAIWDRDLSGPFAMFNLYVEHAVKRYKYALGLLDQSHDFKTDATFNLDRRKAPWPKDKQALDALWKKRVMNDWLRLKLADKKPDDIRKVLTRRYKGFIERVSKLDGQDA